MIFLLYFCVAAYIYCRYCNTKVCSRCKPRLQGWLKCMLKNNQRLNDNICISLMSSIIFLVSTISIFQPLNSFNFIFMNNSNTNYDKQNITIIFVRSPLTITCLISLPNAAVCRLKLSCFQHCCYCQGNLSKKEYLASASAKLYHHF